MSLHFVQLQLAVKGHYSHADMGSILEVGNLLAGLSVDHTVWRKTNV